MLHVKANAGEFLVLGRRGRLRNLGPAGSTWLLPGGTLVKVPSTKQEAHFELTQESKDGVPLRLKGIVLYRVVDPVAAATAFPFAEGGGGAQIRQLVEHVCLGELRDVVSRLTMQICIEERKTTLSQAVAEALARVAAGEGQGDGGSWGIALDLVQVAQVFVVDDQLRSHFESELRGEVEARSEEAAVRSAERRELARLTSRRHLLEEELESERQAQRVARERRELEQAAEAERIEGEARLRATAARTEIDADEQTRLARELSGRRLAEAELETARERARIAEARLDLDLALEKVRLEAEAPVRELELELAARRADLEVATRRVQNDAHALEVEHDLLQRRAEQALEKEILPLRQTPEIAAALSRLFEGADLSIYGAEAAWAPMLQTLVGLVGRGLDACAPERAS